MGAARWRENRDRLACAEKACRQKGIAVVAPCPLLRVEHTGRMPGFVWEEMRNKLPTRAKEAPRAHGVLWGWRSLNASVQPLHMELPQIASCIGPNSSHSGAGFVTGNPFGVKDSK